MITLTDFDVDMARAYELLNDFPDHAGCALRQWRGQLDGAAVAS